MSQRIEQITRGTFSVGPGSLFPALHRLEANGSLVSQWGASENNRQARFYKLTKKGERQLRDERAQWERMTLAVQKILETEA